MGRITKKTETKTRKKVCFIVEGNSDKIILEHIFNKKFPKSDYNIVYCVAHSYSSMMSSVRPIIDRVPAETKILVVYDSDTTNPRTSEEKMDLVKYIINYSMFKDRVGVFSFDPYIETIFPKKIHLTKDIDSYVKAVNDNLTTIMNQKTIQQMVKFIEE